MITGAISPRGSVSLFNPATGIPTEPKVRALAGWMKTSSCGFIAGWNAPTRRCILLSARRAIIMLTGQRVEEIARLHVDQWDANERIIDWSKTKNKQPHAIPVPSLAAELIKSIKPNEYGWFFPSAKDPSRARQPRHAV